MKKLVKSIVELVDNHKVFVLISLAIAILLGIAFQDCAAPGSFLFFAIGIRVFSNVWHAVDNEQPWVKFAFRLFGVGGILFLTAGIINIWVLLLETYQIPTFVLDTLTQVVGWSGAACIGVFMVGVIGYLLICGWNSLVRWAH